jgi:putative ABC transport system permease protein
MLYALRHTLRRLRHFVGRRSFERDVDEELRFHMEMAAERHVAHGYSLDEVRELTHKEFGSMHRHKEEIRDARGLTLGDDLGRDIRFALRTLRRTPGFTIIALITFALGIGANTAIFSVVNAVLIRPLPYPNATRAVRLFETTQDVPGYGSVNYLNLMDWKRGATNSFERIGAYYVSNITMDSDGEPERLREGMLGADVLPVLGTKPMLGRVFLAEEEIRGKDRVVILGEALWRRRFGSDPSIVGKTVMLESTPFTVVGVMPAGFNFPPGPRQADLYAPFVPPQQAVDPRARGWHWLQVVALLKPGVTMERANLALKQVAARIAVAEPLSMAKRSAAVVSMREALVGDVRGMLYVLLGAVFLVLLIACANVANLLLARNASRKKDVAVRVALGASRAQLARQFLTESIVLALLGATLGLGVSWALLKVLITLGPQALPVGTNIPIDVRVMLAMLGAAVLCGVAFGIAPALQLSSDSVSGGLAGLSVKTTHGGEMQRFGSALVVAQVALSLMLLVGAGLLMRGFLALQSTDPGIVSERVLTARVAVPRRLLRSAAVETTELLRPMLERVRAVPGVRSAALNSLLPIDQTGTSASFWVDRTTWPAPGNEPLFEVRVVSPGFLATMGIQLEAGRDFTESDDTTGVQKTIVNEAAVRRLMPGENAIGRHLLQGRPPHTTEFEIIGVASDVKQSGLDVPTSPEMYTSYADSRADWAGGDMSLVVKTAVPEASIVPEVRQAVKEVARDAALLNIRSMNDVIDQSLSGRKFTLALFAIFAGVALALAVSGLYGVIYYLVTQRTREIGIRVALGADKARVVRLVLRQGFVLVAGGVLTGLIGAFLLSRMLGNMLYGVGTHDPLTFAAVSVMLGTIAMLATAFPAWRAARVDPVIALRAE